jgi:hypothetical protein
MVKMAFLTKPNLAVSRNKKRKTDELHEEKKLVLNIQ